MRTRYRIAVGGTWLDSIDKNLVILDIAYSAPDFQITQNKVANLYGYDIGTTYFEKQTVTVSFELHIYDIKERNEVCQAVNKWASAGGVLITNDREGQRLLDVRCEKYASIESARNWTDPLTLVFATTYNPFWQSTEQKTAVLETTGTSKSKALSMDGNYGEALLSVDFTAKAVIANVKIACGDTMLWLKGLGLKNNDILTIDYVHRRILRIRVNGKSVMSKLDPTSSDRLTIPCGEKTTVKIVASNKFTATVKARGMWL